MTTEGPANKNAADSYFKELKLLIEKNVAENAKLVGRINELLKDAYKAAGSGRIIDPSAQPDQLRRWLDFNIASYNVMSAHTFAMINGLISAAESALFGKEAASTVTESKDGARDEIQLKGRPGERIEAPFLVKNQFDNPLDISFEAGDLIPISGATISASNIKFKPAALKLNPEEQKVVYVIVTITDDFLVGQTYNSNIRVLGFQAKEISLDITVLPPLDATVSTPRMVSSDKTRPKTAKSGKPSVTPKKKSSSKSTK